MERRSDRERWHDDPWHEERAVRRARHDDAERAAPGHEWEHERTAGAQRRGERSWEASPREPERRHGAHGSAYGDSQAWQRDEGHHRQPHESPGSFGERSYAGYGDWSAARPEDERMHGWSAERRQARRPFDDEHAQTSAERWGLGRAGARDRWGADLRGAVEARAGRFAGRGPRGYRRSDERIREDVCELLLADGEVDASDIEVSVASGEVTLQGTVPDRRMKRAAEDLIEAVSGIEQVDNRLRVQTATQSETTAGAVDSSGRRLA